MSEIIFFQSPYTGYKYAGLVSGSDQELLVDPIKWFCESPRMNLTASQTLIRRVLRSIRENRPARKGVINESSQGGNIWSHSWEIWDLDEVPARVMKEPWFEPIFEIVKLDELMKV